MSNYKKIKSECEKLKVFYNAHKNIIGIGLDEWGYIVYKKEVVTPTWSGGYTKIEVEAGTPITKDWLNIGEL